MATRLAASAWTTIDQDSYSWALEQAALLRTRQFGELDLESLAEEIEDLAGAQYREVRRRLRTIIEHLLKLACSPTPLPRASWLRTVRVQRNDLHDILTHSLRQKVEPEFAELYAQARALAVADLMDRREIADPADVPEVATFDLDRVLDRTWWPAKPNLHLAETTRTYELHEDGAPFDAS